MIQQARFAHASEAELARILDFYGIRWQYEPRTFPIMWSLEGKVIESFSPDFYLLDLDQYIELTTLKQSLVRRKNRKLRRLRELYPDIHIKLFYGKDFRALMLKYGRFDLAASLSGLEGQAAADLANRQPRPERVTSAPTAGASAAAGAAAAAAAGATTGTAAGAIGSVGTEATAVAVTDNVHDDTAAADRRSRGARRRRGRRVYLAAPATA